MRLEKHVVSKLLKEGYSLHTLACFSCVFREMEQTFLAYLAWLSTQMKLDLLSLHTTFGYSAFLQHKEGTNFPTYLEIQLSLDVLLGLNLRFHCIRSNRCLNCHRSN